MIRSQFKVLGVLLLVVVAFVFSAGTGSTRDIPEFIDIPVTGDVQATVDPALACRNGVMIGLHAIDRLALTENGARNWDISFANSDGNLLIKEYPLWLGKSETALVRNGITFPYAGTFTLLWNEVLPAEPLTTCLAGAGSGFCEFKLEIDDCEINLGLVADIAQIGPLDTTRSISDTLVYEVRAYDPKVGTANGDGIVTVEMKILDLENNLEVLSTERVTALSTQTGVSYCAFSEECAPWVFSEHNYTWPSGDPVKPGYYLLRATVSTPNNERVVVQTQIEVDVPPNFKTVRVPAGEFTMGSDTGTQSESPIHVVQVDDFWIMQNEVTNNQYVQCVKAGACTNPKDGGRLHDPAYVDHPVTNIDWGQANDFAAWAGGRLPTEAEWEKACRSTDGRTYPWGDALPTQKIANYDNVLGDTMPVGSYPDGSSPYGTLDMSGNVWEWTSSLFAEYPYQAGDGREDRDAGDPRTVRGGSFYYTHYQLTCTTRLPAAVGEGHAQIGLRVVFDQSLDEVGIRILEPADGATVPPTFDIVMDPNALIIEPAGEIHEGAGHFHILLDTDFVAPGELIPFDDDHLHFGDGRTTTTIELKPGVHTLRLQFANGAHLALEGEQYRDEITVTVEAGKSGY